MNDNALSTQEITQSISELKVWLEEINLSLNKVRSAAIPSSTYQNAARSLRKLIDMEKYLTSMDEEYRNNRAVAQISQVVNSSLDIDVVLRIVMDTIIRLTNAERGFLMLKTQSQLLKTRIARNWEQETIDPSEFAVSNTVVQRVYQDGIPIITTNAQEDPRFLSQNSVIAFNLRSILCVPLRVRNEIIGVIYADNRIRSGMFTQQALDLLSAFANQAAVALDNAQLFASVRKTLAEVTELKNLMDNVFDSIASGVITTDTKEIILLCNRAAEQILGMQAANIIGKNLSEVFPPFTNILGYELTKVMAENYQVKDIELSPQIPSRGQVDLRLSLSPLQDSQKDTQGVAIVMDDLTEKKQLEAQQRLFERMVSPVITRQLDPDKLQLGGKRTEITVLFADIRGFTSFSERISPEQLVQILNRYLSAAADEVLKMEGTIDKFLGDAIMAWFNAPIRQEDHCLRAVKAAVNIRNAIHAIHEEYPPEFRLSFGMGIHFGVAILGLVGNEKRLEYTAIGDSVNIAKRIQENAQSGHILISEAVYEKVKQNVWISTMDPILAKGKSQPIRVYKVESLKA
ncbi:MAG: hypothetical protein CVU39_01875 [Chloroflexi bacterium HGW-Chloroflexi-10]|nr:MAG: hypothetical protein CVU39_01875 [Chloroflexi bacterium HGW-Chloroflexi-10]